MNDLEQMAIERLKAASDMSLMAYQKPLVICISGGKDSGVITELAVRSGIPCEFLHSHTTADAPETVRFVRSEFKRLEEKGYKCTVNMPVYKGKRVSMWSLIPQKLLPPSRKMRYCCSVLKETGGAGRFICTGVRWAESASRKNSREIGKWVQKAYSEHVRGGVTIVMLIPARTDTSYFHDYIYGKAEIRFLRGRLKFEDENGAAMNPAPFPSMVVIYR